MTSHTSMIYHCRELEAETLAEGGGCLDKDIVAVESSEDDFTLERSVMFYVSV